MLKKAIAAGLLSRSGLGSLLRLAVRWSGVLVFNYHRVGDGSASDFDRGLWSASVKDFTFQIRCCKSQLEMITAEDLPRVLGSAGRGRAGRYGMITFDDGYRDNYSSVFPILKKEGVPATYFVTTGFMDSPCVPWWDEIAWMVRVSRRDVLDLAEWLREPVPVDDPDRERCVRTLLRGYKALSAESTDAYLDAIAKATGSGRCSTEMGRDLWMTWDMLREMHAAGMTIGGHTVTHAILAQGTEDRQREEIAGCSSRLEEEIGEPMRCFSYPVGGPGAFDAVSRAIMREVGVQYGFSYYGGYRRFDEWDDYDIRRIPVEAHVTQDWFRSIVSLPGIFA